MGDLPYIIAVDFDGTLCVNKWPRIGDTNVSLFFYLFDQKYFHGAKIILWTCRTGKRLEEAIEWCKTRGLEFDAINDNIPEAVAEFDGDARKIFANEYIDDKNAPTNRRYTLPFTGLLS